MARHRITGEFVIEMIGRDCHPDDTAERLVDLMTRRMNDPGIVVCDVYVSDDGCEVVRTDEDEADDAAWEQADADYDRMQETES